MLVYLIYGSKKDTQTRNGEIYEHGNLCFAVQLFQNG